MAPQKPFARSVLLNDYTIIGSQIKVAKKKPKARNSSKPSLRRKNGTLNVAIRARSELMQISAKHNSLNSPLLRLPGEIRNKIWNYAVGYHQINISHSSYGRSSPIVSSCEVRPLYTNANLRTFIRPTFQLYKVCRQMYVETSAMIYMLNTFGFKGSGTFDRWIKKRAIGQRRLINSVDIPYEYMRLYRGGFRKLFREKLPNIKRIGVDMLVPYFSQHLGEDSLEMAKQRVIDFIKEKEGECVKVGWHTSMVGSPLTY
ncbi:uncharacterized protein K460DRAFT_437847 [Cucurbitaria berberidis CBS 394.84]|uniref:DUF7730 domain-containing protein n=1 Tax=Cucurbitaria berberidis CBS 394.84 TaxID=1168544 RepID=A0A9P4G6H8_9PLEO|nr:uncharacterized protein K460DRAFT_437847 [Cucurbitaria berberidis CBS 394.84]KAF1839896.1 hypothetical protein K460DRAFT_437847 [Cucurbitaria berberidis CBS 394.84]